MGRSKVDCNKLLSFYVDENLTWSTHVETIKKNNFIWSLRFEKDDTNVYTAML